ncbi:hypothetical protein HPB52_001573 [Rhipicephalus sanguineus]|uniref:Uncharacterized protein n=1 Tax=Rhipicephalus sanguineus TaxID=34632 RepID=A0A9D4SRC7_RHISA|nr:hypothetical protein HPB52_001573 [Rhipicephalus sanguineus]
MDIHLRFWSTTPEHVMTQYCSPLFMGHSTAEELQEKFLGGLTNLPLEKIVQLSMDGPNVNLK